jgi:ubiquinone/menaquinone biosynthesis C-methylase UbiE
MALTMREGRWRPVLLAAVSETLPRAGTVVDVGAGMGSFAIALAAERPDAAVLGIDGDAQVLERARGKQGADRVEWRTGLAGALPLSAGQADVIVMSLLLHHLEPDAKRAALTDARAALRPGGWLHVADWGRPRGALPRAGFAALRVLDGRAGTADHAAGRLLALIAEAGFADPSPGMRLSTPWGTLELIAAQRP